MLIVWLILFVPVFLGLFALVLEIGNLWLARVELTHALESAALAAVKSWGDSNGGNTLIPRQVGNAFASANTINGAAVDLSALDINLNRDGGEACNQNACGDGVLVFGAIVDDDPEFEFNCCDVPACGTGTIWLDASAQSSLAGSNNEWGISYQPFEFPVPAGALRIRRVVYELHDVGSLQPRFDFSTSSTVPQISGAQTDDNSNASVQSTGNNCPNGDSGQADVYGIDPAQIVFYVNVTDPCTLGNGDPVPNTGIAGQHQILAIEFPDDVDPDDRFDPMDRIRFGTNVVNLGTGSFGGDQVGIVATTVTVCLTDGTDDFTCTGNFTNTDFKSNQCLKCPDVAFWGINVQPPVAVAQNRGLIVHPSMVPDIPCPPSSGNNNDGQSLASFVVGECGEGGGGGTGNAFAVRAQASYNVPSIVNQLSGLPIGPFSVTAHADALYNCATKKPQLYHLKTNKFFCTVTCP
ncbi:MAG: hypothetical protein KDA80_01440 [Planctomycetaceae bacterium]|nr:hypothetical protein [Planctomycetaceae bacterium]